MTIGAIIQARMNSARLPGKVLLSLLRKPMLDYVLERIACAQLVSRIVIATSDEASDDPIYAFCQNRKVECYRGPLDNVVQRFLGVIDQYGFDAFVRICADSPFIDQRIVDQAVRIFRNSDYDMITNTLTRSFPKGQSVEVVGADVFRATYAHLREPDDFEHVTRYFHKHKDQFKIYNFSAEEDTSEVQLSVDTLEDFKVAEKILRAMDRPHVEYGFEDILKIYQHVSSV